MPDDLHEIVLDLAWSLWGALGVPGWKQTKHETTVIDPEALILFTAKLRSLDSRLHSEAYEWCRAHQSLLSSVRLSHFRDASTELRGPETDAFLRALEVPLRKPSAPQRHALTIATRGRVYEVHAFDKPSQIALRLRSLFGVSARAEIVRVLLAYPQSAFSAPEFALQINYVRRNVARALESLLRGGLLTSLADRNAVRFVLARPRELRDFVGVESAHYPAWTQLLEFTAGFLSLDADAERVSSVSRVVLATRFLDSHAALIELHRLPPPPRISDTGAWPLFRQWALTTLAAIASNEGALLHTPAVPPVLGRRRPPRRVKARAQGQATAGLRSRRSS